MSVGKVRSPRNLASALMAAVAAAGWGLTAVAIASRAKTRVQLSPISAHVTYVETKRRALSTASRPVVLHQTTYRSNGRAATIRWFDSDFESLSPRAIGIVSLYIDGDRIASTIKTSLTGVFEDGPGDLVWRGFLPKGAHRVEVRFDSDANWGMPYTDPGYDGTDELIIDQSRGDAS